MSTIVTAMWFVWGAILGCFSGAWLTVHELRRRRRAATPQVTAPYRTPAQVTSHTGSVEIVRERVERNVQLNVSILPPNPPPNVRLVRAPQNDENDHIRELVRDAFAAHAQDRAVRPVDDEQARLTAQTAQVLEDFLMRAYSRNGVAVLATAAAIVALFYGMRAATTTPTDPTP